MNHGGDAAEQIVRMSLQGVEVAAKITGTAAKEVALLILAALKSPDKKGDGLKLKGKERMAAMLKSGKPLEIFSMKEGDLEKFSQAAKQYGIVYCVLKNSKDCPDNMCDVMVKADDAPKISRIIERFHFATVDKAKIESEIVAERADRTAEASADPTMPTGAEPEAPDIDDTEKLLDELLGTPEGKAEPDMPEPEKAEPGKEPKDARPLANGGEPPRNSPSEPTSESRKKSAKQRTSSKPSVKGELREITAAQKAREKDAPRREERPAEKPGRRLETKHTQPPRGKYKPKRLKER